MIKTSILILTKDGGSDFSSCLSAVFSQRDTAPYEVVIIDSGSRDDTLENARKYPVRIETIAPESFHHARTRNYAASLAAGEYLIFLSQDAIPVSSSWLKSLLCNFDDPLVGGVYGRQVPKPGSGSERHEVLGALYGDSRIIKRLGDGNALGHKYYHFSSVNSAIRRDVWEATKFPEDLKVFEDVGIAKRILDSKWTIVYEPSAAVYHSHNFEIDFLFKRYFDIGVIYERLGIWNSSSTRSVRQAGWKTVYQKLRRISKPGTVSSLLKDGAKFAAIQLGRREKFIPRALKKNLSAYKLFD